jgi:hypothetical protein
MPNSRHRPVCLICQRAMTIELQPSGIPPRTFQCLECERLDPMNSQGIAGLMKAFSHPSRSVAAGKY